MFCSILVLKDKNEYNSNQTHFIPVLHISISVFNRCKKPHTFPVKIRVDNG